MGRQPLTFQPGIMMNVMLAESQEPASTASYRQRRDEESSAAVDRGILVQTSFNTVCAIEYMKSHNVAPQVIERVLLHPDQRRKSSH
jgi:hypothetical protein